MTFFQNELELYFLLRPEADNKLSLIVQKKALPLYEELGWIKI